MAEIKEQTIERILDKEKIAYFLFGFAISGDEFPFKSEEEKASLWVKYQEELMEAIYSEYTPADLYACDANQLRPAEWFKREAPERRRILNDAKFLGYDPESGHSLYDKSPALETDAEYLARLGLLNLKDLKKMGRPEFLIEEGRVLNFRKFLMKEKNGIDRQTEESIGETASPSR